MDFDLSDEQRLLKDQVSGLIAKEYGFEQRKAYAREPLGYSAARWAQFAELGLLALPFAEAQGGIGGTPVETMIVMEAFGRGLVLEPYLATVVLGGGLLRFAGSTAQRQEMIPAIAGGTLRLAFAHGERQARYDLADVVVTAMPPTASSSRRAPPAASASATASVSSLSIPRQRESPCRATRRWTACAPPRSPSATSGWAPRRCSGRAITRCRSSSAPSISPSPRQSPRR